MPGQNTIKVIKKHLMTRKVRIMVWQEERDSVTDMAYLLGRLCCQDFSNVYVSGCSKWLHAEKNQCIIKSDGDRTKD
jgi:hypothetical protein